MWHLNGVWIVKTKNVIEWFKVTFSTPSLRSFHHLLKGSLWLISHRWRWNQEKLQGWFGRVWTLLMNILAFVSNDLENHAETQNETEFEHVKGCLAGKSPCARLFVSKKWRFSAAILIVCLWKLWREYESVLLFPSFTEATFRNTAKPRRTRQISSANSTERGHHTLSRWHSSMFPWYALYAVYFMPQITKPISSQNRIVYRCFLSPLFFAHVDDIW